jgi:hypothetical protein
MIIQLAKKQKPILGACRAKGIESEKVAERGQILTISPAHSGTMGQEIGEILTA